MELKYQLGEIITQIIAFVVFFWIMKKFAVKPILELLAQRQQRIEQGFVDIDRKLASADNLKAQYEAKLRDIEQESRVKIQEAIAEGRRVSEEIIEKARVESTQVFERTQQNLQLELAKARVELRKDVVELTLQASERLLNQRLNDTEQRKLVDAFVVDIERRDSL